MTLNNFLAGRPIPSLLFGDLNLDPECEYYDEDYSSVLSKTIEWRDSVYRDFKDKWLKEYLLSLREKDSASYCPPRVWKVGEVALFKLPNKAKAFWPLARVLETFPDENQVVRTFRVLKSDQSEAVVNVNHLISLELYLELNNPQIYSANSDESSKGDGDSANELVSDSDSSVSEGPAARPSRKTARSSRAQTKGLAHRGLV